MAGNGLMVMGSNVKRIQAYTPSQVALDSAVVSIDASPGWFKNYDDSKYGFRAVFGIDGGANHPDTVTVFRAEVEYPDPLGRVNTHSGQVLELSQNLRDGVIADGDIIVLINGPNNAVLLEVQDWEDAKITYKNNGRFTGPSGPPDTFPVEGSAVFNLRNVSLVTYYVDQDNYRLMAAHHDQSYTGYDSPATKSSVVANNIEDLQLYYFFDSEEVNPDKLNLDPDISSDRLDDSTIKAVAVAMTSRSGYGEGATGRTRPALFNSQAGEESDNRRRNTLTEYIYLRNYQQ
jgi:hypothetical protein